MPWVGFPNTNGVPSAPVGSWVNYEQVADRIYGLEWIATEAGTISHLNLRIGNNWSPGPNGAFIVVYNNGTKVAQSPISSPTLSSWTGELSIAVVSGQSLNFAQNDVLVFGLAFDGDGSNPTGLGIDNGSSYDNEYAVVTVGSTGPPSSVTFSTSGTYDGLGVILRYSAGGTTRQFAANINGITSTPAIDMAVARKLAANISGASTTSDVDLTRLMAFSAQIAGTTLTSDVDLAVDRAIVAGVAAITSTADIDLAVLREISANITGASNTSDIELTLAGIITFAASIAGVSVTSDAALSVARVLSATINGTTADTAAIDLAVLRTLSTNISATSITSAIDLVIAALGLIINPSLRSLTVQRSLVSKTVKRTVKSV